MLILSVRNSQWIFVLYRILGYVGNSVNAGIPHFENYISRPRVLLLLGVVGRCHFSRIQMSPSPVLRRVIGSGGQTNNGRGGVRLLGSLNRLEFWQICLVFFRGLITGLLSSHTFLHVFLRFKNVCSIFFSCNLRESCDESRSFF